MNQARTSSVLDSRQKEHRWVIAATVTLMVLLVTLVLPITASASQIENSAPPHGGTLNIAELGFPSGFSPAQDSINDVFTNPMEPVYGLLAYENSKTGAVVLQFLKSITGSNNNKTWTLDLKPGIKFSDGTALNADAIAYTLKKQADPNTGYAFQRFIASYKWKVINDLSLQINLPSADAGFPAEVTQEFPFIGSPTAWAKEGANFPTHPVGAGPFEVQSYIQNSTMTLVPNPYYKAFAPGEPYLSKLVYHVYSAATQQMASLTTGETQIAWLQGGQEFNQARTAGLTVVPYTSSGGQDLVFNTTRPPFNNVLAREAVSLAVSHQGESTAWSPGTTAQASLFAPNSPYYNSKYKFPAQNTAKATQLFKELAAKGDPVHFTITGLVGYESLATYMQAQLDRFPDVSVKINTVDGSQYVSDAAAHNFQLTLNGADYVNPWPALANLLGKNGPQNYGLYVDAATDKALAVIATTSNKATLIKEWGIVQARYNKEFPMFTAQQSQLAMTYPKTIGGVSVVEYGATPLWEKVFIKSS